MLVVVGEGHRADAAGADEVADRQRPAHQVDVVERLVEDGRVLRSGQSPIPRAVGALVVDLRDELDLGRLLEVVRHLR